MGRPLYLRSVADRPSLLSGILNMRCPYCRRGRFYASQPYDLKRMGEVLDECPACHRNYKIEYGFYMGAMYVAYGISAMIGFVTYLMMAWAFPDWETIWHLLMMALMVFVLAPLTFSYSRVIYGYIFIPYRGPGDPNAGPKERRADRWR